MHSMSDLLSTLSPQQLATLCSRHGLTGRPLAKRQMVGELAKVLTDPDHLLTHLRSLRPPVLLFLHLAALAGPQLLHQEDLLHLLPDPPEALVQEALGLISRGGDVPAPVIRALGQIWAGELAIAATVHSGPAADPSRPCVPTALHNLIAILGAAARRELPLTQQDELYKKAESDLLTRCDLTGGGDPEGSVLILLDFARDRGLLAEAPYPQSGSKVRSGLVVSPAVGPWVQQPWALLWAEVADYLFSLFTMVFGPVPLLLHTLMALPPGHWLPVDEMGEQVDRLMAPEDSYWDRPSGHSLRQLLMLMAGLDLLTVGALPDKQLLVRPAPALTALLSGQQPPLPAPERFTVRPDLTIQAPPSAAAGTLYQLERLSRARWAQESIWFTLHPTAVHAALEEGDSPESLLAFFEHEAARPLPPALPAALREWTTQTARARFEQATLLRVSDPETAARIQSDKRLAKWLLGALTPTDLLVDPAGVEQVRKLLSALAVSVPPGVMPASRAPAASAQPPGTPTAQPPGTPTAQPPAHAPLARRRRDPAAALRQATPEGLAADWLGVPPAPAPAALLAGALLAGTPGGAAGVAAAGEGQAPANQAEAAAWLRAAAAEREVLRIGYESDGALKHFTVHPQRVLDDRLVADCPDLGGSRKFKLARIRSVEHLGERF